MRTAYVRWQAVLDALPVSRIWGVGRVTQAALSAAGILTIRQLRETPMAVLERLFGHQTEHVLALAQYAAVYTRSWAVDRMNGRVRLKAENDRLLEKLAQLEAMIRAQKGFKRSPEGSADAARLQRAYETLGVSSDASNSDIKKAYRRLMNRNHPDKLAGDNPADDVIAEAERRTREVRAAYEMLKARRSIR